MDLIALQQAKALLYPRVRLVGKKVFLPLGLGIVDLNVPSGAGVDQVYCDPKNGLDTNTAVTTGSPKKSLGATVSKGLSLTGTQVVVNVKTDPADPTSWVRDYPQINATKPVWIVPWVQPSVVIVGSKRLTAGWTSDGSGLYHQTVGAIASAAMTCVVVTDMTDADGFQYKLPKTTGSQTTPPTGTFGYAANVLYVNLPDGSDPGTHAIEYEFNPYAVNIIGSQRVTFVDPIVRYAGQHLIKAGGASGTPGGDVVVVNGLAQYTGDALVGGCYGTDNTATSLICLWSAGQRAANDGFNIGSSSGSATVTLVEPEASYNNDEGISPHEANKLYIFGGRAHHNAGGGGMTAVHQSHTEMYGTLVEKNHTAGAVAGEGAITFLDTATGKVVGCVSTGDPGSGFVVQDTATVERHMTRSYGNGSPDVNGTAAELATITGRGPDMSDRDATVLAPKTIWVPCFITPAEMGGAWNTITLGSTNFLAARLDGSTQGMFVGWDVVLSKGTWSVDLFHTPGTNRGIYTVLLDGSTILGTVDGYNAVTTARKDSITGIVLTRDRVRRVRVLVNTKNASSSGYVGALSALAFVKTG